MGCAISCRNLRRAKLSRFRSLAFSHDSASDLTIRTMRSFARDDETTRRRDEDTRKSGKYEMGFLRVLPRKIIQEPSARWSFPASSFLHSPSSVLVFFLPLTRYSHEAETKDIPYAYRRYLAARIPNHIHYTLLGPSPAAVDYYNTLEANVPHDSSLSLSLALLPRVSRYVVTLRSEEERKLVGSQSHVNLRAWEIHSGSSQFFHIPKAMYIVQWLDHRYDRIYSSGQRVSITRGQVAPMPTCMYVHWMCLLVGNRYIIDEFLRICKNKGVGAGAGALSTA